MEASIAYMTAAKIGLLVRAGTLAGDNAFPVLNDQDRNTCNIGADELLGCQPLPRAG